MNCNSPDPRWGRALLFVMLGLATMAPISAWAQKSFFECAKDPKSCAPIQRPQSATLPAAPAAPASAAALPAVSASEPAPAPTIPAAAATPALGTTAPAAATSQASGPGAQGTLANPPSIDYRPGRRQALVIGNNAYQRVATLETARQDARAMADVLRSMGFGVVLHEDLAEKPMKQAVRDFKAQVAPGDEVLIFYAGHGVQISGTNYLLPVDIRGDGEDQVRDDAIPLQRILDDMQDRKAGFTLAVIDACRDNPFRAGGRALGGRGLAATEATSGQMIIFSAGAGQRALDRLPGETDARNGVFTRVFLREMVKPNVPVDRVLRTVRQEVVQLARSAGAEQTPALYDQALGDFYFRVEQASAPRRP